MGECLRVRTNKPNRRVSRTKLNPGPSHPCARSPGPGPFWEASPATHLFQDPRGAFHTRGARAFCAGAQPGQSLLQAAVGESGADCKHLHGAPAVPLRPGTRPGRAGGSKRRHVGSHAPTVEKRRWTRNRLPICISTRAQSRTWGLSGGEPVRGLQRGGGAPAGSFKAMAID